MHDNPNLAPPLLAALERHYDELVDHVRRRFRERSGDGGFAREVVHDVCVQVLESPPATAVHTPLAWLRTATSHRAIDRCRADDHRQSVVQEVSDLPEHHADPVDGAEALHWQQQLAALVRSVEALPPRARQVFLLQRLHGMPQQEIADAMGISRNMVAQHHARAMRAIEADCEPALRQAFPSCEALLDEARAQAARRRGRKRAASAAGGALAASALALLAWLDPAWRHETLRTAIAERSTLTLADGSTLMLAPDTVLLAQTRLFSRQFTLTRGEAMFSVGKGALHAWRPFIVHAAGADVRDIGTRFNVKLGEHGLQVTVTEGSVEISAPRPGAAPQRVLAGQAWTLDGRSAPNGPALVAPADVAQATAWQRGRLVFDGMPLAQALAEVQRYRHAPLRVLDERAARMRLSGEYDAAGVEALIDALPATLPVRVQRAADGSVAVHSR